MGVALGTAVEVDEGVRVAVAVTGGAIVWFGVSDGERVGEGWLEPEEVGVAGDEAGVHALSMLTSSSKAATAFLNVGMNAVGQSRIKDNPFYQTCTWNHPLLTETPFLLPNIYEKLRIDLRASFAYQIIYTFIISFVL